MVAIRLKCKIIFVRLQYIEKLLSDGFVNIHQALSTMQIYGARHQEFKKLQLLMKSP